MRTNQMYSILIQRAVLVQFEPSASNKHPV